MKKVIKVSPTKLGAKLRQIRKSLGFSQTEILRELGYEERLFRSNISQYERGDREPPLLVLLSYARIFDIDVEYLIDDELILPLKEK